MPGLTIGAIRYGRTDRLTLIVEEFRIGKLFEFENKVEVFIVFRDLKG